MKYTMEEQDEIIIISLKSSLEGGPDTFQLRDDVKAKLDSGDRRFLLDMTNAGFVNSTGIGVVVSISASIKSAGGKMKICGVSERARRAFVTTGVLQLFDVRDSQDDALKSFDA